MYQPELGVVSIYFTSSHFNSKGESESKVLSSLGPARLAFPSLSSRPPPRRTPEALIEVVYS